MGNNLVKVTKYNITRIQSDISPNSYTWLSVHSQESHLSVVEVKRLWIRYLQLGANKTNGLWKNNEALKSDKKISKMEFLRFLLTKLIEPKKEELSFCEFTNAIYWLNHSCNHDKLVVLFSLINEGQPITEDSMKKFISLCMPDKTSQDIENLVDNIFRILGGKTDATKNLISKTDFVTYLENNIDSDYIENALNIDIISLKKDKNVKVEEKTIKSEDKSLDDTISELDKFPTNTSIPTNKQLEKLTQFIVEEIDVQQKITEDPAISNLIYHKLAGILGILEYDVVHLEAIHRGNRYKTVMSVLREWKLKEGSRAFTSVLKRALFLAGLPNIVNKIEFT